LDFSSVLRASLRQDPDIILVGEIRDVETAEISLRASMTGHLVLSTLHTNDSISSATRLIDMGVEPFLAASSIRAIVAQRLVRKLCEECAEAQTLTKDEHAWMTRHVDEHLVLNGTPKRAVGCHRCNQTGFRGRIGIFEMLRMDDDIADALRRADNALFVERAKEQKGFKPLLVSALEHVINGVTTIQEAIRVAQQFETDVPDLATFMKSDSGDNGALKSTEDNPSLSLEVMN
ncbi:MAG: ATPase, T2SS/T4P/T4SS family, partial [Halieaceae bacterium]